MVASTLGPASHLQAPAGVARTAQGLDEGSLIRIIGRRTKPRRGQTNLDKIVPGRLAGPHEPGEEHPPPGGLSLLLAGKGGRDAGAG
jgi:hypothetical protein